MREGSSPIPLSSSPVDEILFHLFCYETRLLEHRLGSSIPAKPEAEPTTGSYGFLC